MTKGVAHGLGCLLASRDTDRDRLLAHLYLHAVIPRLADLVRVDSQARDLASGLNLTVELVVAGGPRVALSFARGTVAVSPEPAGWGAAALFFPSCRALNRMFEGGKVTPVPFKAAAFHLGGLKKFSALSDRLTRVLKPSAEDLKDAGLRACYVELSLLTGLSAACVLAQRDPAMAKAVGPLHDGVLLYDVLGGPKAHVVIRKPHFEARPGAVERPLATLEIKDVDYAVEVIAGRVDTFAAVGLTDIRITGDANVLDEFNMIFDRVGLYLK
jgi:hypothetical protein